MAETAAPVSTGRIFVSRQARRVIGGKADHAARLFIVLVGTVLFFTAVPATGNAGGVENAGIGRTQNVKLTSLEWPPYSGKTLPDLGVSSAIVAAAFSAAGYQTEMSFFPWRRTVALVRRETDFIGYYPEYDSPEVRAEFLLSDPIGTGPLGFAEHVSAPVIWSSLDDLARHTVGVVLGYVNSVEFDRRVRERRQAVDYARDDKQNLLKLSIRRVRLALIDRRVFDHLVRHDPDVRAIAANLRFNDRLLATKKLHVCFRNTPEGRKMRDLFNEGLKRVNTDTVINKDFSSSTELQK